MQQSPAVVLSGPRGSGKADLARREFPGHRYLSMADTADRLRARRDPAAFLGSLRAAAVIDEAQRAPELALHLQHQRTGQWLLLSPVRLELKGVPELHLFPPSLAERESRPLPSLEALARYRPPLKPPTTVRLETLLTTASSASERDLEDDIRTLTGLHDADRFHAFVALAAGASGQVVDQSAWARACGVTHTTIARWLSALERSFRIALLPPYEESFGQRLVRRRKLYVLDPGLTPEAQRFAAWGVGEVMKSFAHAGQPLSLSHWMTATGLEAGMVVGYEAGAVAVSFTRMPAASPAMLGAAAKWRKIDSRHAAVVFTTGSVSREMEGVVVHPWFAL